MDIGEIKPTITSIFMAKTLKLSRDTLRDNGYINAFIEDEMRDVKYENCIHLLFHPNNMDRFREFINNEYENNKQLIDDYDYPEGYVVLIYKLNEKFKNDFELVKKGKYSKTSIAFQNEFPKTVVVFRNGMPREEVSIQHRVFNKTKDLIELWEEKFGVRFTEDQEIWDGFHRENEVLTEEKLKEYL